MELHPSPGLTAQPDARRICLRYLERLPLSPERRREVLRRALALGGDNTAASMAALHKVLNDSAPDAAPASTAPEHSMRGRLALAPQAVARSGLPFSTNLQHRERLLTMPPFNRASMVPQHWPLWRFFARIGAARHRGRAADGPDLRSGDFGPPPERRDAQENWHAAGAVRRVLLLGLVIAQTYAATEFMAAVLPYHGTQVMEIATLVLFAILFGWVSAGFWTAMAGFLLLVRGSDRFAISRTLAGKESAPIADEARTAIVMPIANEDVARVFAGLRATHESLARTGLLRHFDFFVLSDSSDADIRVAELDAWLTLCHAVDGFDHVFYRWRQHRIKRKSGNIADFCRRWGRNYRYMVVLDADSVMSGECLTTLVRLSEANPGTGIIQTAPRAAGRETLYARVQQFATRVYGPLFTAGLHFWQLGESHYWGHNAIIRVAPFMRHCALGRLPGGGALSGEILSHDFVEAALMRRAGWAVWIAYDLTGSYEEMPPNLVDELKRDRRWCQGNLMNFRLFTMRGLHPAHRAVFMTGVMAYLSAPLWFAFLILSTALLAVHTLSEPQYFVQPYQLFPLWPEWRPEWAIGLFSATATLLFLPKLLAVALISIKDGRTFGGRARLTLGMFGEFILSALLAPVRMLFHTQFVLGAFANIKLHWKSPPRDDAETGWREAVRRHGAQTLLGVAWASGVYWLNPSFLWWLLPIVGALMLSIPLSVLSSRVRLGRRARAAGLFLIPEESDPPPEIRATEHYLRQARPAPAFVDAVVDPVTNALACAARVARTRLPVSARKQRRALVRRALEGGPGSLTQPQKALLLGDPVALSKLHFAVWTSPAAHDGWQTGRGDEPRSWMPGWQGADSAQLAVAASD